MEQKIPNRIVENTGQILILAFFSTEKEGGALSDRQSNSGKQLGVVFSALA
jgi:hypothetical protein